MRSRALPAALAAVLGPWLAALPAQREPMAGLVALRQACLDATTDAVVLNVAAHPDDESSRSNVILRRKHGLRVVTVYATYGDGGQNAIGREIGPELAELRVRETLRAAATSDVEVRWLGMTDFGFSKTLEETLRVWGEAPLRTAMAAVVAEVDPDLAITNHNLTQGHGHHRAAFWAAREVLQTRSATGERAIPLYRRSGVADAHWRLDPGELDLVRGETYARLAWRSWTQHVTQGPWGEHNPLQVGTDHWSLAWPEPPAALDPLPGLPSVFAEPAFVAALAAEGVDAGALQADLQAFGGDATAREHGERAARVLPVLLRLRERLHETHTAAAATAQRRLDRRIDAVQRVLLAANGVAVESWLERDTVALGGDGRAFVVVHGFGAVRDLQVRCQGAAAEPVQVAIRGGGGDLPPETPPPTAPAGDRFSVRFRCPANGDGAPPGSPETAWVALDVTFTLHGQPIALQPRHWFTPVQPVALEWDRQVVMVPRGQQVERVLSASVVAHRDGDLDEPLRLAMGHGIRAEAIPGRLRLSPEHPEARVLVRATFDGAAIDQPGELRLEVAGARAALAVVPVEVFVPPGLRVGLVRGPDDTLERALTDLGVAYTALSRDDLAVARLDEFGTVLLDLRAYHHRPELAEHRDRLLQYCRAGGRVVAMYHKPNEWNERAGHPLLAPFALVVGNERVTEEDSPVKLLQPDHRLWTHPHQITAADFTGWVQERGLNFPSRWDAAWAPLLEVRDSGDEAPHQGALLYTRYGRGDFVYCSLVLYRQLRVGHAGAARLLVNLLSR